MFKLKYFKYIIISIFALLLGSCTETTNQVRPTRSQAANNVTSSNPPARGPADTLALRTNSKEHRLALVIGNNDYQDSYMGKLRNAVNDAKAIRAELTKRDFKVLHHYNATRKQMLNAVDDFTQQLSSNTVAIVFYAGHGMQIKGSNYLLPVDIEVEDERDVVHNGINLRELLNQMGAKQTKFSLAIIDACRNNPLKGHGRSAGARGLTNPRSSTGVVVLYSAGENQQALDRLGNNDPNPNGLFTREFLSAIKEPGLDVRGVIQKTRETVNAKAKTVGHEQMPAIYDQSVGSFVFTPGVRREEREIQALKARAEAAEQKAKLAATRLETQTITDFTPALHCMDNLLLSNSLKGFTITYGGILDSTSKKVGAAITSNGKMEEHNLLISAKKMLLKAASIMSIRSKSLIFIDYVDSYAFAKAMHKIKDLASGNTIITEPNEILPLYYISGSISQVQFDENTISSQDINTLGLSKNQISSVITLTMRIGQTLTRKLLLSVHSSNYLVVNKSENHNELRGKIGNTNMSFNINMNEGSGVRALINLGMVELIGKFLDVPYWKCL
ncbi:hypothetical protein TI05_12910 [Achromatium sp. WMS3]|nr:hypothetical protein TI05_12910 [Achromatium sp. WMS3]